MALAAIVAFVVALALVRLLASDAARVIALDRPNERSLHVRPTPRLGGIGLIGGAVAGWLVAASAIAYPVAPSLAILVAVSLADDVVDMPALARLLAQLVAGALFLALATAVPWWLWPPLVIAMTWSANLFNFMDGSDGLAGGMAMIGFGAYAAVAALAGETALSVACAAVSAAAAGFLVWNFHPARIFMGDAGSVPLGFLAAALGIVGVERGAWGLWLPALVFSPFLFDATVTLLRRFLDGEKVWQAHRTHYYQRVIRMGAGHRTTALAAYALMGLVALTAIAGRGLGLGPGIAVSALWLAAFVMLARRIDAAWALHQAAAGAPVPPQPRQP